MSAFEALSHLQLLPSLVHYRKQQLAWVLFRNLVKLYLFVVKLGAILKNVFTLVVLVLASVLGLGAFLECG